MAIINKEYRDFSWDTHLKAKYRPLVAQIELTFRCPLHCHHCYTDCYNNKEAAKKELTIKQLIRILDKCEKDGVLWLCFTGGDPLIRKDFSEIYTYAKRLGFIITVFTSLIPLNNKLVKMFKKYPPFNIETTLNASSNRTYREITKTTFFKKHLDSVRLLLKNNLQVIVKTKITRQNLNQIDKIKNLIESLGLKFSPSTLLHARLNKDTLPCNLRIQPEEAISIGENYRYFEEDDIHCLRKNSQLADLIGKPTDSKLLKCAVGADSFWISPYGKMFLCGSLRNYDYDISKEGHAVKEGFYTLNKKIHSMHFQTKSPCRVCKYRLICYWCPGRAYLEKGSLEEPIGYFCQQAKIESARRN